MTQELFHHYESLPGVWDELFDATGTPRRGLASLIRSLNEMSTAKFKTRQTLASGAFLTGGVTFSVYSDRRGVEKIFPFDLIPRVVSAAHWKRLERGLEQRVRALNIFLGDLYGKQQILRDGIVPKELVEGSKGFLPQMCGIRPPGDVYIHIAGIDLVRDDNGQFLVLEDNLRCPSGVSYVLENRLMMKRVLGKVFTKSRVRSVGVYPTKLREALLSLAPRAENESRAVVMTPGAFNSAYFEHSYLARRMGIELVQGSDLFTKRNRVYVRTTRGPKRVDVIYRRVDDRFLDPKVFNADSLLGVPGLVRAYAAGNVTLANAIGNGVADDKAIYPFIPDVIRYYLKEDPIIAQVPTFICARTDDYRYVREHLNELVVKAVDAAGGYGMLFGPRSTQAEVKQFAKQLDANPRGYIAQHVVELSTCPVWTKKGIAPRRVDLRPYVIQGKDIWVLPGGLTRVALEEGSYVVNSSQGGGSKDTWVLQGAAQ